MNRLISTFLILIIPISCFSQSVKKSIDRVDYISKYKNTNSDESAAIDFLKGDILNTVPKYCTFVNNEIPNGLSQATSLHLKNYVKKVCDLYLYEQDSYRVNYKKTLDAMRYEGNNLIKLISKLSNKDRSIVINYLKSLD